MDAMTLLMVPPPPRVTGQTRPVAPTHRINPAGERSRVGDTFERPPGGQPCGYRFTQDRIEVGSVRPDPGPDVGHADVLPGGVDVDAPDHTTAAAVENGVGEA